MRQKEKRRVLQGQGQEPVQSKKEKIRQQADSNILPE
jgi:hypothetical protein